MRRHILKFPGRWKWDSRDWWWDFLLRGLLSNMQEKRFAATGWPELCPVAFSLPGGLLIVMSRATPLTDAEWKRLDYRAFVTRGEGYAEDILFDSVELGNALERRARDRCGTRVGEFVKIAPHMRPAKCKRDVATLGELGVAGIAIDLQDPLEAVEMGDRPLGLAIWRVDIGNPQWIRPAPRTVIGGIGP
jgi:hypothetical protein